MIGGNYIWLPKFMAEILMESHLEIKDLKQSLIDLDIKYDEKYDNFENVEFYLFPREAL